MHYCPNSFIINSYINNQSTMSKQEIEGKNIQSGDEQEDTNEGTKKLSKGQKKRLKQKQKEQEQAGKKQEVVSEVKQEEGQKQEKTETKEQKTKKEDKKKKGGKGNAAALLAKKKQQEEQRFREQQERKRKQFEAEEERKRLEQQQKQRKIKEEKQRKFQEQNARKEKLKKDGLLLNKKQEEKLKRARAQLQQNQKKNEQVEDNQNQKQIQKTQKQIVEQLQKKERQKKKEDSKLLRDDKLDFALQEGKFRSPVCCILGHVDTGKTTLLDKIRKTNVQEGQAGGITQQIGATFFPKAKLVEETEKCKGILDIDVTVPGLLIIDTPGHESFSNLRSRGSSLCDVAILVIDIQHGLEPQTLESLQLLKKGKTPFVVALNKIDRSYGWEAFKDASSYYSLKKQMPQAVDDYKSKLQKVITQLNQKGYNACLYWQNQDPQQYISLVPTSGITGEGIPDLLTMVVHNSLTTPSIKKRIKIHKDRFKCTVMEVKMIEGYGTTIDCLLVDGVIKKEDQVVLLGFQGPIITKVKALLTPHPMKQMRVKDQYIHHSVIHAANGVKIAANNLDQAVAGSPIIVANTQEQIEEAIIVCKDELVSIEKKFKLENLGVGVAASTLGSLEALMQYLRVQKIPVSHISVGPVSREDVIKGMKSLLSQIPERRKEEYACLLVFDVKVLQDAQKYAEENGIKIFTANIIYHLTDHFKKHVTEIKQKRRQKEGKQAVFPCILKQVATFRKSDPIVLGVDVQFGVLKIGTPICVFKENQKTGDKQIKIGVVQSIEHNHKKLQEARKQNGSVAISLGGDPSIMSGRHFDPKDKLVSIISRTSIDCLKEHYRQEVKKDEWALVIELKKYFNIF